MITNQFHQNPQRMKLIILRFLCKALVALVYTLDFVSSQYTKERILNRNYFAMNLIVLAKLP